MACLPVRPRTLLPALALVAALAVTGCGSKGPGVPGTAAVKRPTTSQKPARPQDAVSPYMVAAVATAKGEAASVQVKFELGSRPEVGVPLEVELVIVPVVGTLEQIYGQFHGEDGLEITSGATIPATDKPVMGTPIHHHLSVLARRDGVFVLNAVIGTQAGGQTESQTFSIPIIVGSGFSAGAGPEPARPATRPANTAAAR